MEKISFIRDELSVSPLCLGTASFGTGLSRKDAFAQLDAFASGGGNFIDTAHVYGDWGDEGPALSERIIGKWFASSGMRKQIVLSTKGAHPRMSMMGEPRVTPEAIEQDVAESLEALGTDYIDLYFLHRDDPAVPVEALLSCLEKLRTSGQIRRYGCSNWTLERITEAEEAAREHGYEGFLCNQAMWSLADINRAAIGDHTLVSMHRAMYRHHLTTGLSAMAYSSLASGYFMRRAQRVPLPEAMIGKYRNESNEALYRLMDDANDIGFTPLDLCLRYIVQQPFPAVPIAAFGSVAHLEEAMMSCRRQLPPQMMEAISEIKRFIYC